MADRTIATREAALADAKAGQARLALSKLRFFDGTLIPDSTTTKADMVAALSTLVGLTVGGEVLTAWSDPQFAQGGGAVITSPAVGIDYASGPAATIGGGWIETAGPGGEVVRVFVFDPPITLAAIGDGFTFLRQLLFGRNP